MGAWTLPLFLIFAALTGQPHFSAYSAAFEVSGTLVAEGSAGAGTSVGHPRYTFTAAVSDCTWQIRAEWQADRVDHRLVVAFDGEYQYRFGYSRREGFDWVMEGGTVDRDEVPLFGPVPYISAIWMAFCQACYLDRNPSLLVPAYQTSWDRAPIRVEMARRRDQARLPEVIEFFNDGFRRGGDVSPWPPPFDAGFREAVYSASEFQRNGAVEIPGSFELTIYQPKQQARTTADTEAVVALLGTVTNMQDGCELKSMVPEVPASDEVWIEDYRFIPSDAITRQPFSYTARRWLSMTEVSALDGFASYERSQPVVSKESPHAVVVGLLDDRKAPSAVAVILLGAVFTAGLLLLICRRRRDRCPTAEHENQ
jgi:hypothetical protein